MKLSHGLGGVEKIRSSPEKGEGTMNELPDLDH
jgi:hypothetical protein